MSLTRDPDTSTVLTCPECDSVHFNVRWGWESRDIAATLWQICCEGCGAIYNLLPDKQIELDAL
jgi:hypothetical protein